MSDRNFTLKKIETDHTRPPEQHTNKANKPQKPYTMSYDRFSKSEWAWMHSTRMHNYSEDSILTKATRAHRSQGVARSTRSRTQKRMAGRDEMYNVLKAEQWADNLVSMNFGYILPSFLNYREVCAQLLKYAQVKAAPLTTSDILADPDWRKMCEELAQGRI